MSVTRFGVSAEKVVATIETPRSHQGISLPEAKNSTALLFAFLATLRPTAREIRKKRPIESQSINCSFTILPPELKGLTSRESFTYIKYKSLYHSSATDYLIPAHKDFCR
jgi:hypothetical protein